MIQPKDDSIFQLSLTELAFVLVFIVLLLIGAKFVLVDAVSSKCQTDLGACNERATACETQHSACREAIAKLGKDPDATISTLVNEPRLRAEIAELRERNERLEAENKAFEELRKKTPDPVRAKAAQEMLDAFEKASKSTVVPGDARKRGEEMARLEKELSDCRGQLKFCQKATAGSKGFGHPPCWADAAGKAQHVFDVEIRADGLAVKQSWPSERETDARQLPNVQATLDAPLQSLEQFKANTLAIFEASKKANPECRHYVVIRRAATLRDIDQFNRLRLGVEDHFYKFDRTGTAGR